MDVRRGVCFGGGEGGSEVAPCHGCLWYACNRTTWREASVADVPHGRRVADWPRLPLAQPELAAHCLGYAPANVLCAPATTCYAVPTRAGGVALVHCMAGISRSASVVIAYLMARHSMTLDSALEHVGRVRPIVSPNLGFLRQLQEIEALQFDFNSWVPWNEQRYLESCGPSGAGSGDLARVGLTGGPSRELEVGGEGSGGREEGGRRRSVERALGMATAKVAVKNALREALFESGLRASGMYERQGGGGVGPGAGAGAEGAAGSGGDSSGAGAGGGGDATGDRPRALASPFGAMEAQAVERDQHGAQAPPPPDAGWARRWWLHASWWLAVGLAAMLAAVGGRAAARHKGQAR